jgi:hypothetical protein
MRDPAGTSSRCWAGLARADPERLQPRPIRQLRLDVRELPGRAHGHRRDRPQRRPAGAAPVRGDRQSERQPKPDHPAALSLRYPNETTTSDAFIRSMFKDFLIYDNAYALMMPAPSTG